MGFWLLIPGVGMGGGGAVVVIVAGPYCVQARQGYVAGAGACTAYVAGPAAACSFIAGAAAKAAYVAGAQAGPLPANREPDSARRSGQDYQRECGLMKQRPLGSKQLGPRKRVKEAKPPISPPVPLPVEPPPLSFDSVIRRLPATARHEISMAAVRWFLLHHPAVAAKHNIPLE